ncbi:MAG: hypothetical protein AVDCRST_MAG93-4870 [uncultured Chloroflexia bacterium]|uniref:Uncharacterized protein n=1 Tax=uncultured Chloroflexia bacterium TaxID=1672391 RepID=A0A6J4KG71_9CHLR|nr:MAG: hypothetical protein AVDCRST_MAG93-4870 [uncultured Chloroflexia bacterium]
MVHGALWTPRAAQQSYRLAMELKRGRINLIVWCMTTIYGLAAQGIQMPADPRYRSDPSIRAG